MRTERLGLAEENSTAVGSVLDRRLTRRGVLKIAGASGLFAASGAVLAACGKSSPSASSSTGVPASAQPSSGPPSSGPPSFVGTKLRVSAIEESYVTGFRDHIAPYLAEMYGIQMDYDAVSVEQDYQRQILGFLRQGSDHDIILVNPTWLPDYFAHLEPLKPLAEKWNLTIDVGDDVYEDMRTYSQWFGDLVAVPWSQGQLWLGYNTDAFSRPENRDEFGRRNAGADLVVPTTWAEYRRLAEFFGTFDWVGDGKKRFGFSESWRRGLWAFNWWLMRFGSFGGIHFAEDMTPLVNSESGVRALEEMLAVKQWAIPGLETIPNPQARAFFYGGDTPMDLNFQSTASVAMDPTRSKIVGKVANASIPGVADGASVYRTPPIPADWLVGIPKYSKNKDAAIHALAYINKPETLVDLTIDPAPTINPYRPSTWQAPEWATERSFSPELLESITTTAAETSKTGMLDILLTGAPEYLAAIALEINLAVVGEKPPKQALDDAATAWEAITNRLGRPRQAEQWATEAKALAARGITYRPELANS